MKKAHKVEKWLIEFAQSYIRFEAQEAHLTTVNILRLGRKDIRTLVERKENRSASEIHDPVYSIAKEISLDPYKFFQPIYLTFLGDSRGPEAGWLMASLTRESAKAMLKETAACRVMV